MGRASKSKTNADQAPFTNKRSRLRTRKLYSTERLGVYLGLNITAEMHAELVAEGEKALMRQSDFARLMLSEGLRVWRATKGRAFRDVPVAGET
jgi:hypothetical protein